MRRFVWLVAAMFLAVTLAACQNSGNDTSNAVPVDSGCSNTDVKVNEGEPADLKCVKITVLNSELAGYQVNVNVRIENTSDNTLPLKVGNFNVTDSTSTKGLPSACGGKGGFTGDLAPHDKIESPVCWFLVGAVPPLTLSYSTSGKGLAIIALTAK